VLPRGHVGEGDPKGDHIVGVKGRGVQVTDGAKKSQTSAEMSQTSTAWRLS